MGYGAIDTIFCSMSCAMMRWLNQPMVAQQMLRCADGAHRGHMR